VWALPWETGLCTAVCTAVYCFSAPSASVLGCALRQGVQAKATALLLDRRCCASVWLCVDVWVAATLLWRCWMTHPYACDIVCHHCRLCVGKNSHTGAAELGGGWWSQLPWPLPSLYRVGPPCYRLHRSQHIFYHVPARFCMLPWSFVLYCASAEAARVLYPTVPASMTGTQALQSLQATLRAACRGGPLRHTLHKVPPCSSRSSVVGSLTCWRPLSGTLLVQRTHSIQTQHCTSAGSAPLACRPRRSATTRHAKQTMHETRASEPPLCRLGLAVSCLLNNRQLGGCCVWCAPPLLVCTPLSAWTSRGGVCVCVCVVDGSGALFPSRPRCIHRPLLWHTAQTVCMYHLALMVMGSNLRLGIRRLTGAQVAAADRPQRIACIRRGTL
jgi:hypothetical protein